MRVLIVTLILMSGLISTSHAQDHQGHEMPAHMPGKVLLLAIDIPLTAELIKEHNITEQLAVQVLEEADARRYARVRALSALAFFPTSTARAVLMAHARQNADPYVQVQALIGLARAHGSSDPAVPALLKSLQIHPEQVVAETARAELGRLTPQVTPPAPTGSITP